MRTESPPDVLMLNGLVILAKFCDALILIIVLILLVCLDRFIMHTTLVFGHEDVVLLALLFSLDLLIQGDNVVLLYLLLLNIPLILLVDDCIILLFDRVSIENICLSIKHLLLLFSADLLI